MVPPPLAIDLRQVFPSSIDLMGSFLLFVHPFHALKSIFRFRAPSELDGHFDIVCDLQLRNSGYVM
jgi:hypothetical protein